jgi:hypothetical protein
MRFLPYILVGSMSIPVLLWIFISNFVVRGSTTNFAVSDLWVLGLLGAIMVVSFYLLSTWMHRSIRETME